MPQSAFSIVQLHHIALFGPNGSGKTTHGRMLAALLDRQYTDMSRVLKLGSAYDPALAQAFARYSSEGDLVPDEIIFKPLELYLQTLRQGDKIVSSGIPRLVSQVDPFFHALAHHLGSSSVIAVDLILTADDAVQRCRSRAERDIAHGRTPRPEDVDEIKIRKRIKMHEDEKAPLLEAFAARDARVIPVSCAEDPQQTLLAILKGAGILNEDLFFKPAGF